ncbi:unnamed protein product [Peniophora sp. CBMAI 1063]|nr:unnamed protein product [Peniophora sp. CBMAI 1063]
MRSPGPTQDLTSEVSSLRSSPALSVRSLSSSSSGAAPPPSEQGGLSASVASVMGIPPAPFIPQAPASPPGLSRRSPSPTSARYGPLISLDFVVFLQWLMTNLDQRGMRQALFWLLSPIGVCLVHPGSIIIHRLRPGFECYGRVTTFLMKSCTEAVFQMRVLGWQTTRGWCAPGGDLFSYLIVPLARCPREYSQTGWNYFHYAFSLQQHVVDIVHNVRAMLDGQLNPTVGHVDWATAWFMLTHLTMPAVRAFEPSISNGLTFMADDLSTPLRQGMAMPPPGFNPNGLVSILV